MGVSIGSEGLLPDGATGPSALPSGSAPWAHEIRESSSWLSAGPCVFWGRRKELLAQQRLQNTYCVLSLWAGIQLGAPLGLALNLKTGNGHETQCGCTHLALTQSNYSSTCHSLPDADVAAGTERVRNLPKATAGTQGVWLHPSLQVSE